MDFGALGRVAILAGIGLVAVGLILMAIGKLPPIGRLPGDILIRRDGVTFSVPLATMIVLSILLTVIVNVVQRLLR